MFGGPENKKRGQGHFAHLPVEENRLFIFE